MLYEVIPATVFQVTVTALLPGVAIIPVGIAGAGVEPDGEPDEELPLPHAASSMMSKPAIHNENTLQRNWVIASAERWC
jgi:hypothetical protein